MGVPYWNTHHDELLADRAEQNTIKAQRKGWSFPDNGRHFKPKLKKARRVMRQVVFDHDE